MSQRPAAPPTHSHPITALDLRSTATLPRCGQMFIHWQAVFLKLILNSLFLGSSAFLDVTIQIYLQHPQNICVKVFCVKDPWVATDVTFWLQNFPSINSPGPPEPAPKKAERRAAILWLSEDTDLEAVGGPEAMEGEWPLFWEF